MLGRLRRGVRWARAMRRSGAAEVAEALVEIRKIEGTGPLRAYEKAFKAGLLLRLGDYDSAERLFSEVVKGTGGSDRADDRYVNLYSSFILAEMRGDRMSEEGLKAQADRVACRAILRRWLPM